ncbi:MFS transporter [Paenibacillus sp. LMG 31456]|uniref:MFS transporter n=1 Tax=Paenibacillus foliorum TaxID=2654974 RepID=A0A972GM97_9BACL|nr:MFS transporter [Paenibacillus foliorum]NOU93312.1 MFS transporter [Paenibacillus foliorum]
MQQKSALWNRNFLSISLSSFFIFMTFYILAVTLPIFVLDNLHGNNQEIGLVTTLFIIAGVIFRPLTGKWLDELNRRNIIFFSLVLYTICSLLYLFVHDFNMLLWLRIFQGVGFGIAATATSAIVIDMIPIDRKGEGIGYFSLFMSLAMVIGPALGLMVVSHFNFTVLFTLCSLLSVMSLICAMITTIPVRDKNTPTDRSWNWRRFIELKAIPISIAGSLLAFSYGAISTFISIYAKELGIEQMASYFFIVFAVMIVLSRPFTGKLFDRKGPHVLVYPGILLFAAGMIWLSQAHSVVVFLLAGGIIGLGYGALLPSFQTIAIQASPSHRRGLATSTYFVLFDTGYGLGSYVLGVVAARTSYHTMYLIGGVVVAFTALIYYRLHHRKEKLAQSQS